MSETSQTIERSDRSSNRRTYYRLQMRSVCYVELGDGNGGVMLNLGEGGFTLQAAEILVHDDFPRMRFRLPKSERWIEAGGKMAWLGKSGKVAGFQFLDLPDDARQQIRDWMFAQTFVAEGPSEAGGLRRALEREEALAGGESFPRSRVNSNGENHQWGAFFPNESELPEKPAPISKAGSRRYSFFPEEATLPLSPQVEEPVASGPAESKQEVSPPKELAVESPAEIVRPISAVAWRSEASSMQAASTQVASTQVAEAMRPEPPPIPMKEPQPTQEESVPAIEPKAAESAASLKPVGAPIAAPLVLNKIPFSDVLSSPHGSRSAYTHTYQAEPATPSRSSWFLTAAIAFACGLGFAWLSMFGPLDFIRGGGHSPSAQPAVTEKTITGETAPGAPDIFSESPAISKRSGSAAAKRKEIVAHTSQNDQTYPAESQSLDTNPTRTESSPVSPSVQEFPGIPTGYVASNSRFLLIRTAPGSQENDTQGGGSVRIGQLIYSPQAIYPEEALRLHIEGIVKVRALVGEDGAVHTVSPVSGPSALVPAALSAVHDWRYEPTLIGDMPVENECEITFVFRL